MMSKICIAIVALISLNFSVFGQDQKQVAKAEINFMEGSLAAAMKVAKEEKKLIFVDAYTTWCGPCKQLKTTTFKDKAAADFFNKNFINLAVDMEKGEGPALSAKWDIEGYPTLLVLDATGKPVNRLLGFAPAKELIAFGAEVLKKN